MFGGATAVIFVIGAFFLVMGVREWRLAAASASWPAVPAEITSSEVHVQSSTGRRAGGGGSIALITYRYLKDGTERTGNRIHFRVQGPWSGGPAGLHARYSVGSVVQAFVDPSDPSRAVLEPGQDWTNVLPFGMGFVAMTGAAGFALLARRWIRRVQQVLPERRRA